MICVCFFQVLKFPFFICAIPPYKLNIQLQPNHVKIKVPPKIYLVILRPAESRSICCSKWRSSRAALGPTESDSLHLRPLCTLELDLRWVVAFVECPRWALDDRRRPCRCGRSWKMIINVRKTEEIKWISNSHLCGAHATPFTQARWFDNRATGVHGTLTSRMMTSHASIATVAR